MLVRLLIVLSIGAAVAGISFDYKLTFGELKLKQHVAKPLAVGGLLKWVII